MTTGSEPPTSIERPSGSEPGKSLRASGSSMIATRRAASPKTSSNVKSLPRRIGKPSEPKYRSLIVVWSVSCGPAGHRSSPRQEAAPSLQGVAVRQVLAGRVSFGTNRETARLVAIAQRRPRRSLRRPAGSVADIRRSESVERAEKVRGRARRDRLRVGKRLLRGGGRRSVR